MLSKKSSKKISFLLAASLLTAALPATTQAGWKKGMEFSGKGSILSLASIASGYITSRLFYRTITVLLREANKIDTGLYKKFPIPAKATSAEENIEIRTQIISLVGNAIERKRHKTQSALELPFWGAFSVIAATAAIYYFKKAYKSFKTTEVTQTLKVCSK